MRIGILIGKYEQLNNWELRIINEIRKTPSLNLVLLIQDGRIREKKPKFLKLFHSLTTKKGIEKLLFQIQTVIETKLYKTKVTVNRDKLVKLLNTVPTIQLYPKRKGFLDIFSEEDSIKVKEYDLDILLRHEFNIIRGDLLNAAKYGIWSFHHGDNSINRGGPAGFWEIILKQPVIGVTLQQLTPELDGGLVIDKSYYNRNWSFIKNNNFILEQSVELLFKNIRKLEKNEFAPKKSTIYYNPLYKSPTLSPLLKYIVSFYSMLIKNKLENVFQKLFKVRYNCWTLFIGKGDFMDSTLFRLSPSKLPKDEFWADPFLFEHNNEDYVFFENYSYKEKTAKISCGKIVNNEVVDIKDALVCDYHLSYPHIFKEGNDIFMIPETSNNKRLEIYKCVDFPSKWDLYSTAFEGESIADTTYFKDEQNQKWLFLNKGFNGEHNSELHIYKIDSLKLDKIQNHHQNPVVIDSRKARNAGAIYQRDGKILRPSQNNSRGIYGYGLNINQIIKLTIDEYIEEKLVSIEPNFKKGLTATHHLHQLKNKFVIDGAYKKKLLKFR